MQKQKDFNQNLRSGFTLIELLVVISIMSTLAGVVLLTTQRGMEKSRDTRRIQELYQLSQSLQLYHSAHNNTYPDVSDLDDPNCEIHGVVWDEGNVVLGEGDPFVKPVFDEKFMGDIQTKERRLLVDGFGSPCIYRYAKVTNPCDGQCAGNYAILYGACESDVCPKNERPLCCAGSSWGEGAGAVDAYDIAIFLKE